MSETLSSLLDQTRAIQERLIESGGELDLETENELTLLSEKMPEKVQKYFNLIKMLESNQDYFKDQKDFYANAEKSTKNLVENIKSRMKSVMVSNAIDELEGIDVKFKLSTSKASLEIDQANLEKDYLTTVITEVPNKEKIKSDIAAGKVIAGVKEIPSYSLRTYAKKGGR